MSLQTQLIDFAKQQLGKPYVLGSTGPDSYDCSGLMYAAYKNVCSIELPRTSTDQFSSGQNVPKDQLQPGDIIFFDTGWTPRKPNHNGIYIGDNKMINATSYYNQVKEEAITSAYWQNAYYGARRILDVQSPFSDIDASSPYFTYIVDLHGRGVIDGYPDGTFRPQNPINRAEVLKIILNAFGIDTSGVSGSSPFSDVQTSDWFFPFVMKAKEEGIVDGYPDGTFKPAQNVIRAEALKMILETSGKNLTTGSSVQYDDCNTSHWFYQYVQYAVAENLLLPETETHYGAASPINRGEVCMVISKLL